MLDVGAPAQPVSLTSLMSAPEQPRVQKQSSADDDDDFMDLARSRVVPLGQQGQQGQQGQGFSGGAVGLQVMARRQNVCVCVCVCVSVVTVAVHVVVVTWLQQY